MENMEYMKCRYVACWCAPVGARASPAQRKADAQTADRKDKHMGSRRAGVGVQVVVREVPDVVIALDTDVLSVRVIRRSTWWVTASRPGRGFSATAHRPECTAHHAPASPHCALRG